MEQFNTRLLSKEDSKKLFKENCLISVSNSNSFLFDENEEFIEHLFNFKNVFVTSPYVYVYNNNNEFVETTMVSSKIFSSREKIIEYLNNKNFLFYIHSIFLQKDINNKNIYWLRSFRLNLEN